MRVPAYIDRRFRTPPVGRDEVDARALEQDLRRSFEGEVRFSPGDRALYSATGANYRQLPIGVVLPRSAFYAHMPARNCGRPPHIAANGAGTSRDPGLPHQPRGRGSTVRRSSGGRPA